METKNWSTKTTLRQLDGPLEDERSHQRDSILQKNESRYCPPMSHGVSPCPSDTSMTHNQSTSPLGRFMIFFLFVILFGNA